MVLGRKLARVGEGQEGRVELNRKELVGFCKCIESLTALIG